MSVSTTTNETIKFKGEMLKDDFFPELDSRWRRVWDFVDLLKLNKKFVEGEMDFSPYRGTPFPISSSLERQKIVDLHRYGFLVTNRQDAICKYKFKLECENRTCDIEQRGYMEFYIHLGNDNLSFIKSFLECLKKEKVMFYIINLTAGNYESNLPEGKESIIVMDVPEEVETINVTKIRDIDSENHMCPTEWKCLTNIDFDHEIIVEDYLWDLCPEVNKLLKNTLYITLITPEYGKGNLEDIILDICSKITNNPYDLEKINNYTMDNNFLDSRWTHVKNYTDLLKINKEFVEGKIKSTPYHFGPLEDPSPKLVKNLVELHRYGLLTVNGQESICLHEGGPNWADEWYDVEQRGYLEFHIHYKDKYLAELLLNNILRKDLIYVICDLGTGKTITNIPKDIKRYNVTRDRSNKEKKDLASTPWRYYTNIKYDTKPIYHLWPQHEGNREINMILRNTISFTVAMREYGKGDIEELILDMWLQLGAKKYDIDECFSVNVRDNVKNDQAYELLDDPIDILNDMYSIKK